MNRDRVDSRMDSTSTIAQLDAQLSAYAVLQIVQTISIETSNLIVWSFITLRACAFQKFIFFLATMVVNKTYKFSAKFIKRLL